MFSDLTWFDLYLIFGGLYWPLSLAAAAVLATLAMMYKRWFVRLPAALAGVFFCVPVIWYAGFTWQDLRHQHQREALYKAHRWTLSSPRTVAGIALPADTVLQLDTDYDMTNKEQVTLDHVLSLDLPVPTRVFGATIEGHFNHDNRSWEGKLTSDQIIDGKPCKKGTVKVTEKSGLAKCTLSSPYHMLGLDLPPGTTIDLSHTLWEFYLPDNSIYAFDSRTGALAFHIEADQSAAPSPPTTGQ